MEELFKYLNEIYPISDALQHHLYKILQVRKIQKKEYLLKEGHVCKHICFINSGMVRCFYTRKNREVSSWFMKEGDFIISVESFFKQKESNESIQALEECDLYCIEYRELQYMYRTFMEFNFIGRVLTEHYYTLSEQRLFYIRMQDAEERYSNLMKYHSELIQRVPSKYIASYLSITVETLSRIRAGKIN